MESEPGVAPHSGLARISVVVPSYNQGEFIEQTVRSILLQAYPDIELLVLDGGSNDGTVEILEKYSPWIAYWRTGKDAGQTAALNEGFKRATGSIIGWQNSDDYYGMGSFLAAGIAVRDNPTAEILHGCTTIIKPDGKLIELEHTEHFSLRDWPDRFPQFPFSNQSMFFSRRIFDRGLLLDEKFTNAMDADFIVRLIESKLQFLFVSGIRGYYRIHGNAKSIKNMKRGLEEAVNICSKVLSNPCAERDLRLAALRGGQGNLRGLFRAGELETYKRCAKQFWSAGGWRGIDAKDLARFSVALMGKFGVAAATCLGKRNRRKNQVHS